MLIYVIPPLLLLFGIVVHNIFRNRKFKPVALRPNCLITRYPIVFLAGPKSPFYFLRYWNQLPRHLFEHGYETIEINLPSNSAPLRQKHLSILVNDLGKEFQKIHLFADSTTEDDLKFIASSNPEQIASISLASNHFATTTDHAILSFNIPPVGPSLIARALSSLHNLVLNNKSRLNPVAVGWQRPRDAQTVLDAYLSHAISLAENDLKCSH